MNSAIKDQIKGIYVLAVTPMHDDYTCNFEALKNNIHKFLEAGVHGVVVGGTYAEYPSMSFEERVELFRQAVAAVGGKVPVVCCTAASGTPEAIRLTQAAKDAGADCVMVTPPYVAEVRQADILHHFESIMNAVDIPIMIYNSTSIGLNLTPDELAELAAYDQVAAVKQANTDLHMQTRTIALTGDKMSVLAGSDGVILGSLALGFHGCSSTLSNLIPEDYVRLYDYVQNGELVKARKLYYAWQPIRDFCRRYGQPASIKLAMNIAGFEGGTVRAPFRPLGEEAREEFIKIWDTYQKERVLDV